MGVLFRLTAAMDEKSAFAVCGLVGVIFSVILFFMISEPKI
jgi:biopolymer transport protein ExbD